MEREREHRETKSQRLKTLERLQRLERSTRPEQILPLFSFEDHEEATKRFEEVDKQQQQQQQRKKEKSKEERLRTGKERMRVVETKTIAMAKAERNNGNDLKSEARMARLDGSHGKYEKVEKGYISGDADDENDQTERVLTQPRTPDRPIWRAKVDSGFGLGSGLGPGITPDTYNTKRTPSTAERTLYTESDDVGCSGSSYATAATTPEDSEGQKQVQRQTWTGINPTERIFETPTKQDRRFIARPKPESPVYNRVKQASAQVYVPPSRPKRGEFATTRAIDEPIEDWYFLVRECLQCEIAGIECGKQIPACRQCQRRFDLNVRGYRALNSSGGNVSGKYGFGEWSRPDGICSTGGRDAGSQCLVQRRWHARDLEKVHALPDKREAVLIRLEGDSDAAWEGKLREAARLLDVYRTQKERRNWALPSQAGRIAGYPAPGAVAENDRLYKKRHEAALNSFYLNNDMNSSSSTTSSTFRGQKAVNPKLRNLYGTLKKIHINNNNNNTNGNDGSRSGSDVQPWWEEHLTYAEQKQKQRERWIERGRQRRLRRVWARDRRRRRREGDGLEPDSDSEDSDASVDSFGARSVHLGVNYCF